MKFTLSSALILFLATAAFWLTLGQGEPIPVIAKGEQGRITESYLENAERWSYGANGERNHSVHLDSGERFSDDPITYLTGLRFEGPDKNGRYWTLTAGAGRLKSNVNELQLIQGVRVKESGGEGLLETPRLRVLIDQQRAVNRAPVSLTLRNSTTTARGLDIDLASGNAKLLSNVETVYVR